MSAWDDDHDGGGGGADGGAADVFWRFSRTVCAAAQHRVRVLQGSSTHVLRGCSWSSKGGRTTWKEEEEAEDERPSILLSTAATTDHK